MRSKGVRGGTRDRGLGRVRELGTKAPPSWIRARDAILDTDDYTGRHLGYAKSPNPNSQSEGELSGKLSDKTTNIDRTFRSSQMRKDISQSH